MVADGLGESGDRGCGTRGSRLPSTPFSRKSGRSESFTGRKSLESSVCPSTEESLCRTGGRGPPAWVERGVGGP